MINVFVAMWQDAKEIITRRMRAIAGSFTFPPLFVSSQTKRAYYMLKKRLQIVCEETNEGLRFSKLRMPQWFVGTRTIWSDLGMPQTRTL